MAPLSLRPSIFLLFLFNFIQYIMASSQAKLSCSGLNTIESRNTIDLQPGYPGMTFAAMDFDICTTAIIPPPKSYVICNNCLRCLSRLKNLTSDHLILSTDSTPPPDDLQAIWFQAPEGSRTPLQGAQCTLSSESGMANGDGDGGGTATDALRSFSKTSVLFVSISFIILMVISLAWLVFYYVQRFRYAHAKDRLQRRLFNAARKALQRIDTRTLKAGDPELDTDCAVCIDPYQLGDLVRMLPCRHVYHKSCIDPWLMEHRTCPMCKADILKYFGYQVSGNGADATRQGDAADSGDVESPDPPSTDSNQYPYPQEAHDPFSYTPTSSPQLVMNSANAKSFSIVPLTVHSKVLPMTNNEDEPQPGPSRSDRASSAGVAERGSSTISTAAQVTRLGPVRGAGTGTSQGQVVLQVRTRAMSCSRATIRKPERAAMPTPVDTPSASHGI